MRTVVEARDNTMLITCPGTGTPDASRRVNIGGSMNCAVRKDSLREKNRGGSAVGYQGSGTPGRRPGHAASSTAASKGAT